MTKIFNVTGTCIPEENYMVDITDKLVQIKAMVDRKEYFVINRGRQYGKTTTLSLLEGFLADEYVVVSISFEALGESTFASEEKFCQAFLGLIYKALRFTNVSGEYRESWKNPAADSFDKLSDHITDMCEHEKLVLMIDEVDKTSNNAVFLNFLSVLRAKFLARRSGRDFTYHSVILAGAHTPMATEVTGYNFSWNIASAFEVEMDFSVGEVAGMLASYEADHNTGMDVEKVAGEIYAYTKGYPVLVSGICKHIDENLDKDWTAGGVRQAVRLLSVEKSPLLERLIENVAENKGLHDLLFFMTKRKRKWTYTPFNGLTTPALMDGYLRVDGGSVVISNRIFEERLLNYFTSKEREDGSL